MNVYGVYILSLKRLLISRLFIAAAAVSSSMSVKIFYFVKYKSYANHGRKLYFRNLMNQKTESFHKVKINVTDDANL